MEYIRISNEILSNISLRKQFEELVSILNIFKENEILLTLNFKVFTYFKTANSEDFKCILITFERFKIYLKFLSIYRGLSFKFKYTSNMCILKLYI